MKYEQVNNGEAHFLEIEVADTDEPPELQFDSTRAMHQADPTNFRFWTPLLLIWFLVAALSFWAMAMPQTRRRFEADFSYQRKDASFDHVQQLSTNTQGITSMKAYPVSPLEMKSFENSANGDRADVESDHNRSVDERKPSMGANTDGRPKLHPHLSQLFATNTSSGITEITSDVQFLLNFAIIGHSKVADDYVLSRITRFNMHIRRAWLSQTFSSLDILAHLFVIFARSVLHRHICTG